MIKNRASGHQSKGHLSMFIQESLIQIKAKLSKLLLNFFKKIYDPKSSQIFYLPLAIYFNLFY